MNIVLWIYLINLVSGIIEPELKIVENGHHGRSSTTRYWDCSRPTCSWNPEGCKGEYNFPCCANRSGGAGPKGKTNNWELPWTHSFV